MKPLRFFSAWFAAAGASFSLPLVASAHPGHDHTDIPTLIRHPFAGAEHLVLSAALLFVAAGAVIFAAWVWRGSSGHGNRARSARLR